MIAYISADGHIRASLDKKWRVHRGDPNPPPPRKCTYEHGVNYGTGNIWSGNLNSAEECCAKCSSIRKCLAWDFVIAKNTGPNCYVKDNSKTKVNNTKRISGTLPPVPPQPVPPAATPSFDDSAWIQVDLPHDYIIGQTFNQTVTRKDSCYLPKVVGWYRKNFTLSSAMVGKAVWLVFEGAYRNSNVYLNGKFIKHHSSGYTAFKVDISTTLIAGENTLAVSLDPTSGEGEWWYSGGGIYRHVWLHAADDLLHLDHWGIVVTNTISNINNNIGFGIDVSISTTVNNNRTTVVKKGDVLLISTLKDFTTGEIVGIAKNPVEIPALVNMTINQSIVLEKGKLWSPTSPQLYVVYSELQFVNEKRVADNKTTRFGIRQTKFDASHGFFLNGKPLKLKGFCGHNSMGGLGIALPRSVHHFRADKFKEVGANAWRMSHNAPSPDLLDYLDEVGIMVMDENRKFDDLESLKDMVIQHRNHPSVIMWSLCNEAGCPLSTGEDAAKAHVQFVRTLDTTRPVTAAMNNGWMENKSMAKGLELVGFNYGGGSTYDSFHKTYPNKPVFASETSRCIIDRGVYNASWAKAHKYNQIDEGTDKCMSKWWSDNAAREYMDGIMVWIGMDFYGEPKPYYWPQVAAKKGIWDLAGIAKDSYYWYRAWWFKDNEGDGEGPPLVHIVPGHWNWPIGKKITVWAYSNCPTVELLLNGKSLGKKEVPKFKWPSAWQIPFAPGILSAHGFDSNGKLICNDSVTTANNPVAIRLTLENAQHEFISNSQDVAIVLAHIVDTNGIVVPISDISISFSVQGSGFVLGVHNGDPNSHVASQFASTFSTFNGAARVWVRTTQSSDNIVLKAISTGLQTGNLIIPVLIEKEKSIFL